MTNGFKKEKLTNTLKNYNMKFKVTLIISFFALFIANAQNEECLEKLSIFTESAKIKNYDAAYEPWMLVRKQCPKLNNAIYVYGEKILKHKIDKAAESEKTAFTNDLIALYKESMLNMPNKFPVGKTEAKMAQLMYDKKIGTKENQFNTFDSAFKKDAKSFTNPKSLYTYFKLMVGLYDNKTKDFQELVDLYTTVTDKVESEQKNYSGKKDALLIKEENGSITSKEKKRLKSYTSYSTAYHQISGGIDKDLGDRANCDKLVPLFEKNFEANKTNVAWLKKAASRLAGKDCDDDPLFVKLVETFHEINPSANSAYYLGRLNEKKNATAEAEKYYNESANLHTEGFEKAKLYYRLAVMSKKRGAKSKAYNYARKTLSAQPSFGKAYLLISSLYASSANNCGTTQFNKRAVYWLAANMAEKAGKVNGSLKKSAAKTATSYKAKAPSKEMIFSEGMAGKKVAIGCWINKSVTVPNI
jgi:tetratricopeptide (TPR) repeat protein